MQNNLIRLNSSPRFSLSPDQAGFGLQSFSIEGKIENPTKKERKLLTPGTIIDDKCPRHRGPACDPGERWRRYDGSCNNLASPLWGSANSAFQRTLLPQYSDGVWRPKVAKTGAALPSARLVSLDWLDAPVLFPHVPQEVALLVGFVKAKFAFDHGSIVMNLRYVRF